jgi:hypothetical protein
MNRSLWVLVLSAAATAGMARNAHAQSADALRLMRATNADRGRYGLGPLKWDSALARAAQDHANRVVWEPQLSHQYAGEPDLITRAGQQGAHFRVVAENIAVGQTAQAVEVEWMHSPPHRRNILDARLNTIGIGVVERDGNLWMVADFAAGVAAMGPPQIEQEVGQLLVKQGIRPVGSISAARQTCAMEHGSAGTARPKFIMRWEGSDLSRLPDVLEEQIHTGRFHTAAVGACNTGNRGAGFTTYRLAVMLF